MANVWDDKSGILLKFLNKLEFIFSSEAENRPNELRRLIEVNETVIRNDSVSS